MRRAYQQAIAILNQSPVTNLVLNSLALAQAGFGETEAALATTRRDIKLFPPSRDDFFGPLVNLCLAQVQAQIGDNTQAITTLKQLLSMPGSSASISLTPELMRLDPIWDPLRQDQDFQTLEKNIANKNKKLFKRNEIFGVSKLVDVTSYR